MFNRLFCIAFFAAFAAIITNPIHAFTERRAAIAITNETGQDLLSVTVFHKYSDDIKNEFNWENVSAGSTVKHSKPLRFGTGDVLPADWWMVVFKDKAGNEYISDPKNFRKLVDGLEKIFSDSIPVISNIILDPSGGLIKNGVQVLGRLALNKESTFDPILGVSFKKHNLLKKDANTTVKIILKSDPEEGVVIQSVDRHADTNYRSLSRTEIKEVNDLTTSALEHLKKQIEEQLKQKQATPSSNAPSLPK